MRGEAPTTLTVGRQSDFVSISIKNGIELVTSIADKNGWDITASEDSAIFTNGSLSDYTTMVFLYTTGDFLVESEFDGLYDWLVSGGNWLGIHAGEPLPLDHPTGFCR